MDLLKAAVPSNHDLATSDLASARDDVFAELASFGEPQGKIGLIDKMSGL